jgi:peptidoglycan/xylan/chitin deacetylase (PgdA/CDA1 family)
MACSLRGWAVVLWHLAPYDWTPRHPEMIADDLTKNVRSRSIILLHDHHEGGEVYEHTDRAGSVDALDLFLRRVKPFLKSVTLKELLEGEYRNEKLP